MVAGIWPHHGGPVGGKEMSQEEGALGRGEVGRRPLRVFQEEILHRPRGQFLELDQEGRGQVERGSDGRKTFGEKRHIEVGLGRMQPDPGHAGGPRHRVGVIRLVHMPEKADPDGFHDGSVVRVGLSISQGRGGFNTIAFSDKRLGHGYNALLWLPLIRRRPSRRSLPRIAPWSRRRCTPNFHSWPSCSPSRLLPATPRTDGTFGWSWPGVLPVRWF